MIPKKIHYTWFSNDPFPTYIKKCMQSWKEYLPEYEFILWDYKAVRNIENVFFKEALEEKKWAFAADYVRLYAVYTQGGIYLDTDVMLHQNFDKLLIHSAFIGRENSFHKVGAAYCRFLTSHCFGAVARHKFIKTCLDYYDKRHFVLSDNKNLPSELRLDQKLLPFIQAVLAVPLGYDWNYRKNNKTEHSDLVIYPSPYFDASLVTGETVCQHLAAGSWRGDKIKQEKITFLYKIEWRIIDLLDKILRRFSYMIIKF